MLTKSIGKLKELIVGVDGGNSNDGIFDNIEKLREMTMGLPSIPMGESIKEKVDHGIIEGSAYKRELLKEDSCECSNIFMSKGTIFYGEGEPRRFLIAVYKGKLAVKYCKIKVERIVTTGEFVYFDPCKKYSVRALEDTWTVNINIVMNGECKYGELE